MCKFLDFKFFNKLPFGIKKPTFEITRTSPFCLNVFIYYFFFNKNIKTVLKVAKIVTDVCLFYIYSKNKIH